MIVGSGYLTPAIGVIPALIGAGVGIASLISSLFGKKDDKSQQPIPIPQSGQPAMQAPQHSDPVQPSPMPQGPPPLTPSGTMPDPSPPQHDPMYAPGPTSYMFNRGHGQVVDSEDPDVNSYLKSRS